MKKNLEILDFENKLTKAEDPYTRFKTNEGWLSCFIGARKEIRAQKGNAVCVEVTETKNPNKPDEPFRNITEYYGEADGEVEVVKPGMPVKEANNKFTTMYVSYAKDVFCELISPPDTNVSPEEAKKLMEQSINLVKQAKKAFE